MKTELITVEGTPVFSGTLVPIKTLFDHLEAGDALEVFLDKFPSVSRQPAVAVLEEARAALAAQLTNEITDSQRLDGFTKLSLQMMTQYHERRTLEWRIHVLIWTLLLAFTYFSLTAGIQVNIFIFTFFICLWIAPHLFWTFMMQVSQADDQEQSRRYRHAADALMCGKPLPSIDDPYKGASKWRKWRDYGQLKWAALIVGTTLTMGLAAVLLMLIKQEYL